MRMKEWLVYIAGVGVIILCAIGLGEIIEPDEAKAQSRADASTERSWRVGNSTVDRIYDADAGVICYVIPEEHCNVGNCTYSPAISCVRVP